MGHNVFIVFSVSPTIKKIIISLFVCQLILLTVQNQKQSKSLTRRPPKVSISVRATIMSKQAQAF